MSNAVAIIGHFDGSSGQVVEWFEFATGFKISIFIIDDDNFKELNTTEENKKRVCKTTDFPQNGKFKGYPLIVSSLWLEKLKELGINKLLSLEPDNRKRQLQLQKAKKNGFELVSAIHPSALILDKAKIEGGVWINAGVIIGYKAEIASGVIINTGARIDHHNILKECCQIDPGVQTAGNVVINERCHIHTGAIIINRVNVGHDTIIGAGSVVLKDVPERCTAVGVPAKLIKVD